MMLDGVEYSPADVSAAVLRGDCPFCGRSGFKVIALHTNQAHAISTKELRVLIGATWGKSICSEEHHKRLSENMQGINPSARGRHIGPRNVSPAGKAVMRANGLKGLANAPRLSPEVLQARGRAVGLSNRGIRRLPMQHGTRREFKRGCRCQECIVANSAHWKALNARRG